MGNSENIGHIILRTVRSLMLMLLWFSRTQQTSLTVRPLRLNIKPSFAQYFPQYSFLFAGNSCLCNCADDNALHNFGYNFHDVKNTLQPERCRMKKLWEIFLSFMKIIWS